VLRTASSASVATRWVKSGDATIGIHVTSCRAAGRIVARWNRVRVADLAVSTVDAQLTAALVVDDLPATIDGIGWVSWWLLAREASGAVTSQPPSGFGTTSRLFLLLSCGSPRSRSRAEIGLCVDHTFEVTPM